MGILTKLLTLPLTGPLDGVIWLAEQLTEQAERELYNEPAIRARLIALEQQLELEEIDEATYMAAEEELLAQLRIARARGK